LTNSHQGKSLQLALAAAPSAHMATVTDSSAAVTFGSKVFCLETSDPYSQCVNVPASAYVRDVLCRAFYNDMGAGMLQLLQSGRAPVAGDELEGLGRRALAQSVPFTIRELAPDGEPKTKGELKLPRLLPQPLNDAAEFTLGANRGRAVPDLLGQWSVLPRHLELEDGKRQLLWSTQSSFPVVDCVDARDRAYQFTVALEHPIALASLRRFLDRIGATPEQPLHLYFCVPEVHFDKWVKEQKFKDAKGVPQEDDEVKKRLKQYALCLPAIAPRDWTAA